MEECIHYCIVFMNTKLGRSKIDCSGKATIFLLIWMKRKRKKNLGICLSLFLHRHFQCLFSSLEFLRKIKFKGRINCPFLQCSMDFSQDDLVN